MARSGKLSKEHFVVDPNTDTGSLQAKVRSLRAALTKAYPALPGQTEQSKKGDWPVPLDKTGKKFLFYGKGSLSARAKVLRSLDEALLLLVKIGNSTQIVGQVPTEPK